MGVIRASYFVADDWTYFQEAATECLALSDLSVLSGIIFQDTKVSVSMSLFK